MGVTAVNISSIDRRPETTLDRIRNVIGMGQVLEAETESHDELEREQRTDKRRLESSVSDLPQECSRPHGPRLPGERPSVLEDVVEDQVQAVFGSTRKVLRDRSSKSTTRRGWRNSSGEVVTGRLQTVTQ